MGISVDGNPETDGRPQALVVGLDVGSTTVKAVVVDGLSGAVLWKDYERHETRQAEKVLDFLSRIESGFDSASALRIFVTGSGGLAISEHIGARFVQEVNAVSHAVERLHPETGSVIELGGQDAKIIIWQVDEASGGQRKLSSMNDKCAGGTGAVIDKINAKLGISTEDLGALPYDGVKVHAVAGKCGVFAETDINGLQKQGVPAGELMASLFDAIVQQNLSVLTRGNTLRPVVLLLGGPNSFIPGLRDAWRHHIPRLWEERNTVLPEGVNPAELVVVPENALYFAALGAAFLGLEEGEEAGRYSGSAALRAFAQEGRSAMRAAFGAPGLVASSEELDDFRGRYALEPHSPPEFAPGQIIEAYLGVDGGSTSTKAVLLGPDATLLARAYQLSKGNPISDTREVLAELRRQVEEKGATLIIRGVGTSGYAKDILKDTIGADVAIVETVAHTQSALHYYDDVDVIVDVGGQDIKVIVINGRKVKDFRLNTQCSAGNGYFLQATAHKFGFSVEEFADAAFSAEHLPVFSYGCAVFMESDIVNFQQLGWSPEEIMAGLAAVLPKNIWLYVVQEPNLAKLGRRFVLQGGTQHNLAAVKSQYDFIKARVPDAEIIVHRYTGESGAIGAALEARRVVNGSGSTFIGFDAVESLAFTSTRDESTRCNFCTNSCLRTFIDTETPEFGSRRFIIATCEKGAVTDVDDMRVIKARIDEVKKRNPNFVEIAGKGAFRAASADPAPEPRPGIGVRLNPVRRRGWEERRAQTKQLRRETVIGIPRVLNMYSYAPFFSAYFQALGIPSSNIVFSDVTSEAMWREGSRRGSIDQCFPSKVALAHVHQLLSSRTKPNLIFFPAMTTLLTELDNVLDSCACPTVAGTPQVVKAAFTKEGDLFAAAGARYFDPVLSFAEPELFERQLLAFAGPAFGATRFENAHAVREGYRALEQFKSGLRAQAEAVLADLEREHRVGIVVLGRPYHNDPGLNHEIVESLQRCGYPVFTVDTLPTSPAILERLFGEEIARGEISSAMDIRDVWKNAYSENSSRKLWAAKYVARHPNLVALDLSSFKCGHDAPMYSVVESIVQAAGRPYFTFHDIDENRPAGSIKIRVETIAYFLQRHQEELLRRAGLEDRIHEALRAYEERIRAGDPFIPQEALGPVGPTRRWGDLVPLELAMSAGGGGPSCGGACGRGSCNGCGPAGSTERGESCGR